MILKIRSFFILYAVLINSIVVVAQDTDFVCDVIEEAEDINKDLKKAQKRFLYFLKDRKKNRAIHYLDVEDVFLDVLDAKLFTPKEYSFSFASYNIKQMHKKYDKIARSLAKEFPDGPEFCSIQKNSKTYEEYDILNKKCKEEFLNRTSPISEILVAAQAVIESNWGRSRFAKKGNNFFGLQVRGNHKNCMRASKDSRVCLFKFSSFTNGVHAYFYNLLTGSYYKNFRQKNKKLQRKKNACTQAKKLAPQLKHYAQDPNYVDKLLDKIDTVCEIVKEHC